MEKTKLDTAQQPLPAIPDVDGAVRHVCRALENLTSLVMRGDSIDREAAARVVREDVACALECLSPTPPLPPQAEAAADAANKSDPDNVS